MYSCNKCTVCAMDISVCKICSVASVIIILFSYVIPIAVDLKENLRLQDRSGSLKCTSVPIDIVSFWKFVPECLELFKGKGIWHRI